MGFIDSEWYWMKSVLIFVALAIVITLIFPPITDDKVKPQVIDPTTGNKIYQKSLNIASIVIYIIATILCIYFAASAGPLSPHGAKVRSIVEVWADIPSDERDKYNLPSV